MERELGGRIRLFHVSLGVIFGLHSRRPVKGTDVVKNRDIVAAKMTPTQIAEAQKLARKWKPK